MYVPSSRRRQDLGISPSKLQRAFVQCAVSLLYRLVSERKDQKKDPSPSRGRMRSSYRKPPNGPEGIFPGEAASSRSGKHQQSWQETESLPRENPLWPLRRNLQLSPVV